MSSSSSTKKTDNSVGKILDYYTGQLKSAGIASAQLDVLILIEDETKKDRGWLLAHPEFEISSKNKSSLKAKFKRRTKHEPMAYIRGHTEFFGRQFYINNQVLEPRAETEIMISQLIYLKIVNPYIADIGTGSGALAITAKLELPDAKVIATDIDSNCLKLAQKNARLNKVKITFLKGDLAKALPIDLDIDIFLANLPYVPNKFKINNAAKMEPRRAIFGGSDGLDLYRSLFSQITDRRQKPRYIFTESLPPQHEKLTSIANSQGYELTNSEDMIQIYKRL